MVAYKHVIADINSLLKKFKKGSSRKLTDGLKKIEKSSDIAEVKEPNYRLVLQKKQKKYKKAVTVPICSV